MISFDLHILYYKSKAKISDQVALSFDPQKWNASFAQCNRQQLSY